jgi:hypothetical protein
MGLVVVSVVLAGLSGARAEQPAAEPAAVEPPDDMGVEIASLKDTITVLQNRVATLESKQETRKLVEEVLADKKMTMDLPSWLENLKFSGDLRLREEYFRRTNHVGNNGNDDRQRFRLRFGFTKQWPAEDLLVGFRLASGADANPMTTNQTMENNFQKHPLWIDQAYAKWTPRALKGLTLTGGKMPQPWVATDMLWDTDVNPEGGWLQYNVPGLGDLEPFVGAGAFSLTYDAGDIPEAALAAYEVGWNWKLMKDLKWTCAANWFVYSNSRIAAATAPWTVRGNTETDSFEIFNLVNKVGFVAFNLPMEACIDYACNPSGDPQGRNGAYSAGIKIGKSEKKADWSFGYTYKYIQANAVVGNFSDEDFGGTNRKGHVWGASYNLSDHCIAGLTLFLTDPIDAPNDEHRMTVMADLMWKF